ncbi:VPLPA-CTERM sorting domain-containing protein [Methylomonas sp. MO1]|uniref:VPLPA-CTERM sorting domain-containing protein n=1 Tax=Methylomonas sp. MO1 TaxID=3073619 RepID=UPI0028A315F4|nr:VPLPA-CTERM sorting domain-containing protein [Methylomonas sp. MO1]MDT4288452.1 VPLPA-CTERM sorting domain-containing protein [Methylomonas sp. MO1]
MSVGGVGVDANALATKTGVKVSTVARVNSYYSEGAAVANITQLADGTIDYHSGINLKITTTSMSDAQHVVLDLLDPFQGTTNLLRAAGDTLTFSYSIFGTVGKSQDTYLFSASNIEDAKNFFAAKTLDFGFFSQFASSNNDVLNLNFDLNLKTQLPVTGLNLGLLVPVPVPAAGWLFAGGLGFLSFTRRQRETTIRA